MPRWRCAVRYKHFVIGSSQACWDCWRTYVSSMIILLFVCGSINALLQLTSSYGPAKVQYEVNSHNCRRSRCGLSSRRSRLRVLRLMLLSRLQRKLISYLSSLHLSTRQYRCPIVKEQTLSVSIFIKELSKAYTAYSPFLL